MAVVPVSAPTVDNRPLSFVPQTGGDNPASFGAGTAAAVGGLGKMVGDAGMEAGQIAADFAFQADRRSAQVADVAYSKSILGTMYHGDGTPQNPGFYNSQGQDAINGQDAATKAMAASKQSIADGLSPRARDMFLKQADVREEHENAVMSAHVFSQTQVANAHASIARIGAANDDATTRYNDPVAIERSAGIIRGEVANQGQTSGWSADQTAQETTIRTSKMYSDVVRKSLASGDVQGAAAMFAKYQPGMDAATSVALAEHLKHPIINAAAAAAVNAELGVSMGGAVGNGSATGGVADTSMSPEAQAFLNTVAGPESAGRYNVRYTPGGGATFDSYAAHPNVREPTKDGRTSDAAGRYQFLSSTYNPIAARLGLTNFSPESQDKAAWDLAKATYHDKTGGDLQNDLQQNGNAPKIADALKGRWPSLPGGSQQGQSMGTFAAGLAKVNQSASSGAAALIADQSRVHPDFSAAADNLMAKYPNDPDMQKAVLAQLSARRSDYNLGIRTQEAKLSKSLPDAEAMLRDGLQPEVSEIAIRHVFAPPQADAWMTRLNEARDFGQIYKGAQYMPLADRPAALDNLTGGIGTKAAMSTMSGKVVTPGAEGAAEDAPAGAGYAKQQKDAATLRAVFKTIDEQVKADPFSYVRNQPDVAAAYKAIDPKDPTTTAAAIRQSQATQRGMGVQESDIRAVGNADAGNLVKQLHYVPPEKADWGLELGKMEKQFGTAWPDVQKDLVRAGLAPSYQALAVMNAPGQEAARSDLTRALQEQATKGEHFGKTVAPLERKAMEDEINTNLAPMRATLPAYSSNSTFESVISPAVTTLATHYATQGTGGADAADRAVKAVLGKYEFNGLLMAPKVYEDKPLGADKILAAGRTVTDSLKDADLRGTTATEARSGSWAALPDGTGAALMKKQVQGNYLPVRRTDGNLVSMPFNALPQAAYNSAAGAVTLGKQGFDPRMQNTPVDQ